jgi:hypothetical protein
MHKENVQFTLKKNYSRYMNNNTGNIIEVFNFFDQDKARFSSLIQTIRIYYSYLFVAKVI